MTRIIVLVAVCVVVFRFVLRPIRVEGVSMLPTYKDGSLGLVNRLAYRFHEPRRGDVVAIRFTDEHIMLMKRVVGLPGETVAFRDGHLLVNGEPLDEPYVKRGCNWEHQPVLDGPDDYFVVGDNRSMEWDEHVKGRAERKRIVGKVL